MRLALAAITLAALAPITASAQPEAYGSSVAIPTYDVDAICATDSDPRGRAYCVRLEQSSYDAVLMLWPQASNIARQYAIKGASGAQKSRAYYQILSQYLEAAMRNEQMQQDAASPPKFIR